MSNDELSADKVKSALRKKREESGQVKRGATSGENSSDLPALPPAIPGDEPDREKVLAALRHARACAIKNSMSSTTFQEAQATTPSRGTSKFKTRGSNPPSGATRVPPPPKSPGDAK